MGSWFPEFSRQSPGQMGLETIFSCWVWLRIFFPGWAGCRMCSKAAESLWQDFPLEQAYGLSSDIGQGFKLALLPR